MRQLKLIPKLLTCCLLVTLFSSHDVKADENIFSDVNNLTSEDTLDKDTILNLHNIFLACKAYWTDQGPEDSYSLAICTLDIIKNPNYGFVQSSDVMIAMEPNNEESFSAFAYHKENKKVWTIDANGIVEQSPSKPKKHRNWQGSGEISIGTNENI